MKLENVWAKASLIPFALHNLIYYSIYVGFILSTSHQLVSFKNSLLLGPRSKWRIGLGFFFFFFFFLSRLQHEEVPWSGIEPEPRKWQHPILNLLSHQGTPEKWLFLRWSSCSFLTGVSGYNFLLFSPHLLWNSAIFHLPVWHVITYYM